MNREKVKGFTLIELMIVVTIIGILASVAIPAYNLYVDRSKVAEAMTLAGFAKEYITEYHKHTGAFPADNASAGLPPAEKIMGNYVSSVRVTDGAVHVTMGNKAGAAMDGKVLSIRPMVVSGYPDVPFSWVCGSSKIPDGMQAVGTDNTDLSDSNLPPPCRDLSASAASDPAGK